MLNYSQADFLQEIFGFSVSSIGSKEDADLAQPVAKEKKDAMEVLIGGLNSQRKFDSSIQNTRKPIQDPELFKQLFQEFQEHHGVLVSSVWTEHRLSIEQYSEHAQKALEIADEMIEAAPQRAIPWTCRCLALGALGRYSEALVANDQALAIDPSDQTNGI